MLDKPGAFLGSQFDLTSANSLPAEQPGATIGPYKLLQQIGEGGMGTVFMAEQTKPVERKVALKIIKPGMDSSQVIARFEAERQALALMDHPNVAKVLDAGMTDKGRPYFVMELVKGVPITQYCDDHRLTPRQRLDLFLQVCHAVQHAHQKGLIHRDIKPTNILVADYDDQPMAKIIDFGVAKALGQHLTEKTLFTAFGQVIGTVEYMSPEQAKLNQLDIDTRSDIYSLGVLLYELLTGETPFDRKRLHSAAFDEVLRIIREEDPPTPSTRLSTSQSLATIAANRQLEPKKLTTLVSGDLDWIIMKALEKDRTRRYETATGLAEDIQRYLADHPVLARRPTRMYRLKKFIRRNKAAVAAGSTGALAILIGLALATVGLVQARRQAERADDEAANARIQATRSEEVAHFLGDMLKGVAPSVALGRDTTMLREIVDKTAGRIDQDLQDQPEVQIELMLTLGQVYHALQLYKQMEANARHTLELARAHFGEQHVTVADALGQLGRALMYLRAADEAETVTRQAIAMQRKLRGPNSLEEAFSLCNLADVLRHTNGPREQRLAEAESAARKCLAIRRMRLGNDNDDTAWALHSLAIVLNVEGNAAEAEAAIREAHAIRVKIHGDNHPFTAIDLNMLGLVVSDEGKFGEAEDCFRRSLTIMENMDGKGKLSQGRGHAWLGEALRKQGKLQEAEAEYREAVAIGTKEVGPDYLDLLEFLAPLARVLAAEGKLDEARQSAQQAVDICQRHSDKVPDRQQQSLRSALREIQTKIDAAASDKK